MDKGTALVTGASSGIGMEIARVLVREGFEVVLVARRTDELEKLAGELRKNGGKARVCAADLTRREAPAEVFAYCEQAKLEIEVLVNNAGFGTNGRFEETDVQREMDLVQVNIAATVHLTKLFLKPMLARKRGRIMNVGSTAGFQPGPYMAVYYASKAFVNSFSEALASENAGRGVTVTVLCPGPTESGFVAAAKMEGAKLFDAMSVSSSKDVAEAGVRGMLKGKVMVVPGFLNKIGVQSTRVTPRVLVRTIAKRLNSKKTH